MSNFEVSTRFRPLSAHSVAVPKHLLIRVVKPSVNLLTEMSTFGYDGEQFFGIAFIQGKRLQFTTAMPVSTMLRVARGDQADKGSGVVELSTHANRPRVQSHAKALREYFIKTACADEKFILPAFAFNFGDESTTREDAPEAVLMIVADDANDTSRNSWPAMFQLPNAIQLDTTDGAHRQGEIKDILDDTRLDADQREHLRRNAIDAKIIFESKRIDAHQDFADCAKAKPITSSIIATFDIRDLRNDRTGQLVRNVPFLAHYVDATASNVNLSANSLKIWSMSAVRQFIGHVVDKYPPPIAGADKVAASVADTTNGAEHFFTALIKEMPQLRALDAARSMAVGDPQRMTPSKFRNTRGGDIALRGLGMALFARAFVYAKSNGIPYQEIAKRLALVDWHLLDCDRGQLPSTASDDGRSEFAAAVRTHVVPPWDSVLVIGESRYRIGGGNEEANQAWDRIKPRFIETSSSLVAAAE